MHYVHVLPCEGRVTKNDSGVGLNPLNTMKGDLNHTPQQLEKIMDTFKIIRFRRNPETGEVTKRVTERGLSLHDAEKHCGKDGTHGDDWFDGFTAE